MGDFFYLCIIPTISEDMLIEYIKDILGFKDLEVKLINDKYVITQTLDCQGSQAIYDFYERTNNLVTKILYDKLDIYIPREMYIIEAKTINEPKLRINLQTEVAVVNNLENYTVIRRIHNNHLGTHITYDLNVPVVNDTEIV